MPWDLAVFWIVLYLSFLAPTERVDSTRIPRHTNLYWNQTSAMFRVANTDHIINVNFGDSIDIICPLYPKGSDPKTWEYYVVYMVNKTEYETCIINDTKRVTFLLNCSEPTRDPQFLYTLLIRGFQSIPGNPDFESGKSYYFISTSQGTRHGMDNQFQGACKDRNMKMMLNVCCGADTPVTQRPTGNGNNPNNPRVTTTTKPPTTTSRRTTTPVKTTQKLYYPKTDSEKHPNGDNLLDEKVIHANGPKNVGLISDNGSSSVAFSVSSILVTLTVSMVICCCR